MFWDDLVRRWRRDAGVLSPRLLRAAGGHVAALPAPRPRRRSRVRLLLLLALVALAALFLLQTRDVHTSTGSTANSTSGGMVLPSVDPACSDPAMQADPPGMGSFGTRGIGYTDELIGSARPWLTSTGAPGLAGHLLVPAAVTESDDGALVTFHDYDTGRQVGVALATSGAQPRPLRVEDPSSVPSDLSPYERVCFAAAVMADPATVAWLGADAGTASLLTFSEFGMAPCPSEPGFCGSAVVISPTASYPSPPHVTVDLRTARVVHHGD